MKNIKEILNPLLANPPSNSPSVSLLLTAHYESRAFLPLVLMSCVAIGVECQQ